MATSQKGNIIDHQVREAISEPVIEQRFKQILTSSSSFRLLS